ncbi:hypothetical protein BC829DRAFT_403400 [Chytridium lagenaria]|nr:hypothetical protein BC829DRAFT_403400 [Chytridium lagenaria]
MSTSRLYVGRLSTSVAETDLWRLFARYGAIRDVTMKTGFGFVEFMREECATTARNEVDGMEFFGERIEVQIAYPEGTSREMRYRKDGILGLFMGLEREMTWKDLKRLVAETVGVEVLFVDVNGKGMG